MSTDEFSLIQTYFTRAPIRPEVRLAVGDDAALLQPPPGLQLVWTMDSLVSGVHFFADDGAADIGYKSLAVNLSDLAAMGAQPVACCLALTMPQADGVWIGDFMQGWNQLAAEHRVDLVGGDTTRGPLAITVSALGWVSPQQVMRRCGARPGDYIAVSGSLGDAGLALRRQLAGDPVPEPLLQKRLRPCPRVALGQWLAGKASAAIDISDGLAADLNHILELSGTGAVVDLDQLPLGDAVRSEVSGSQWALPLSAGDDYELCVTLPDPSILASAPEPMTVVGRVREQKNIQWQVNGEKVDIEAGGYRHFGGQS